LQVVTEASMTRIDPVDLVKQVEMVPSCAGICAYETPIMVPSTAMTASTVIEPRDKRWRRIASPLSSS
jgi:hypothetical protein